MVFNTQIIFFLLDTIIDTAKIIDCSLQSQCQFYSTTLEFRISHSLVSLFLLVVHYVARIWNSVCKLYESTSMARVPDTVMFYWIKWNVEHLVLAIKSILVPPKEFLFFRLVPPEKFIFSVGASQRIPIFSVGASREIHFFGWCLPKNS